MIGQVWSDMIGHDRTRPDTKSDIPDTDAHDPVQNGPDITGHKPDIPDTFRTCNRT